MWEMSSEGLSVAIITRDQEKKLHKCLKAIRETLPEAEIVVLDTGSRDGSLDTAKGFTENVHSHPWGDDFSEAKNKAAEYASNDLILIIDSDEYLEKGSSSVKEILKLYKTYPEAVGRISRRNSYINELDQEMEYNEWINRLFDRRLFSFEGRIHEQVSRIQGEDKLSYKTYKTGLKIFHDGYDLSREELINKAERNLRLLKKELENKPSDPYLLYQTGKTLFVSGDKKEAASYLKKAASLTDPDQEYLTDLIILAGYSLVDAGNAAEALEFSEGYTGIKRYSGDPDFMFMYGNVLMNNLRFEEAKETFISCTSLPESRVRGTNSFLAWYNAGVIAEVTGNKALAADYYKKAGAYEKARSGLERISSS